MPSVFRQFARILFLAVFIAMTGPAVAQLSIPGLATGDQSSESQGAEQSQAEEPLRQLLEVLKNDGAREKLITELEQTLAESPGDGETDTSDGATANTEQEPTQSSAPPSSQVTEDLRNLGAQVADFAQQTGAQVRRTAIQFWAQLVALPRNLGTISNSDIGTITAISSYLAILVVITYGGLFLMRLLTDRLRRRLHVTINSDSWISKLVGVGATICIDIFNMLVPWALGYAAVLGFIGQPGVTGFTQLLYLNAFAVTELIMAVLRSVLAPNRDGARMVSLDGDQARRVLRWVRILTMLFVYGQLLVLPMISRTLSYGAGRAIGIVGLVIVLGVLCAAVWRSHAFVAALLLKWSRGRYGLGALARHWHIPAYLYLATLFVVVLIQPFSAIYRIVQANAFMAGAILTGFIVIRILTGIVGQGITLPENISNRIPLLERRINAFVPRAMQVVRVIVVLAIIFFCLHMLGAMDFILFLESEFGSRLVWGGLTVILLLGGTFLVWLVLNSWVEYRINPDSGRAVSARERTLLALLRNALTITLIVITLMFVLSELGLNIAPLLASAGVIGLAIGFGAQKLVQDIITGIFIQLEGAIDVGDVVSIGGISGVVERLTVRSASLRDLEGRYHVIPFSSVDTVTNFMRGFSFALIDMGVAYRENIDDAKQAMFDAYEELKQDSEISQHLLDELEWMGLDSFGASDIVLRARIKTLPGQQWATKRAYNAIIKRIFDERGIEIPFPHQTIYFGEDKRGNAPPIHVAPASEADTAAETAQEEKPKPVRRRKKQAEKPKQDLPDPDAGPDGGR